jgi:hypothetical protein
MMNDAIRVYLGYGTVGIQQLMGIESVVKEL